MLFLLGLLAFPAEQVVAADDDDHASGARHTHSHDHPHVHAHDDDDELNENSKSGPLTAGPLIGVYCVLIVVASMLGGWLPSLIRLTHTRMQIMISFVGGLMLGIGLLHLLPHAVAVLGPGSLDRVVLWILGGLLVMFFLLRTFHFHQHEPIDQDCHDCTEPHADRSEGSSSDGLPVQPVADSRGATGDSASGAPVDGHSHPHAHIHNHAHGHEHSHGVHQLTWVGVAIGLSLHTLIDGLALAATVQADSGHEVLGGLFGLGTFLAILLHKPLDAVSITSLMVASGWSRFARRLVNLGFALMCPLGAALFLLGIQRFSHIQSEIVGCALGFSAGVFLCISLGDLLPEMEFHSHNRLQLSVSLLAGIALAWGIGFLEPEHAHDHGAADSEKHSLRVETPTEREPKAVIPIRETQATI